MRLDVLLAEASFSHTRGWRFRALEEQGGRLTQPDAKARYGRTVCIFLCARCISKHRISKKRGRIEKHKLLVQN